MSDGVQRRNPQLYRSTVSGGEGQADQDFEALNQILQNVVAQVGRLSQAQRSGQANLPKPIQEPQNILHG